MKNMFLGKKTCGGLHNRKRVIVGGYGVSP